MAKGRSGEQEAKRAGIKRVAEVAGVSPTTVSRVLNDRGYISQETRDRVHRAMKEVNYTPNDMARALLNKRTNLIGMIVPGVSSPFHGQLVEEVERALAERGFKMLLCNSANRPDLELAYVDMLRRSMVDGIIVCTHNIGVKEYEESGLALVAIDCNLGPDVVTVASDNFRIGELAARRLVDRGCRRILCIRSNSRMVSEGNKRTEAYLHVMAETGLEPLVREVEFVKPAEEKAAYLAKVLDEEPGIDGIFAGDDVMAAICLGVCAERGLRVPEDIRVVGVDGARQTLTMRPGLTTVRQPIDLIAQTAADAMVALVGGGEARGNTMLPVELLEGATA